MAGFILTTASSLMCPHGSPVSISPGNSRVKAGGSPVATLADMFSVSGCPFQVPVGAGTKPQPCIKVQWVATAVRVKAGGSPVILQDSSGICLSAEQIPQGPPSVTMTQVRVRGT